MSVAEKGNTTFPCYQEVEPKNIRSSFTKIKQQLGKAGAQGEDTSVRVLLSNVIILAISNQQQSSDYYYSLIDTLSVSHPSRFFIVEYNCADEVTEPLKSAIGVRSVTVKTGTETITEELYLSAAGDQVKVLPNLLLSHLAPDVPIITVLLNDPRDANKLSNSEQREHHALSFKSLLISIEEMSDVVIYDSSQFDDFRKSINALLSFKKVLAAKQSAEMVSSIGRPLKGGVALAELRDISWRRTKRWRALIAEHFDGELGEDLPKNITSLSFIYESDPKAKPSLSGDILLTASWIFSSLSLQVEQVKIIDGMIKVTSRTMYGAEVEIDFIAKRDVDSLRESSNLRAVLLQFSLAGKPTALSFRVVPNLELCEIIRERISKGKAPEQLYARRVSFSDYDNKQLVLEELSSPVRDSIYREVRDRSLEFARLLQFVESE